MAKIDASSSLRTMEMWLLPFAAMFTRPSWLNAVALATGALLCLNRRTVCAALRAVDGSSHISIVRRLLDASIFAMAPSSARP